MIDKNGLDLLCDLSVLQLCLRPSTNREVVDPRTDRPTHVEPGGTVHGKDLSGTLLCDTRIKEILIDLVACRVKVSYPLLKAKLTRSSNIRKVINAVLPVGQVLPAKVG